MTDAKERFVKNLKQTKEEHRLEELDILLEQAQCDLADARRTLGDCKRTVREVLYSVQTADEFAQSL